MITGKRTGAGETAVANVGSQGVFSQGGEACLSITVYFFEPTNPGQKAPYCGSVGRDWFRENHPGLKLLSSKTFVYISINRFPSFSSVEVCWGEERCVVPTNLQMFCLKTIVIEFSNLLASGGGNTAKESGSSESCQKSCQVQTFGGFETSLKTVNSSEMGSEVGERVGYKVRFQEQSGPNTQVSLKLKEKTPILSRFFF